MSETNVHPLVVAAVVVAALNIGVLVASYTDTKRNAPDTSKMGGRGALNENVAPSVLPTVPERTPPHEQAELLAGPGSWSEDSVFWVAPTRYAVLNEWQRKNKAQRPQCDPGDAELAFRTETIRNRQQRVAALAICERPVSTSATEAVDTAATRPNVWARTVARREKHPPPFATLCHPYVQGSSKKVRKYWADYYLERGFEKVVFYVGSAENAYEAPGVVNVVANFLQNDKTKYFGQVWAMAHCLHTNKVWGTQWTMFADVDEFLSPLSNIKDVVAMRQHTGPKHSITFGSKTAEGVDFKTTENMQEVLAKGPPATWDLGTAICSGKACKSRCDVCTGHFGYRKQLLNVSAACMPAVHDSRMDFDLTASPEGICRGSGVIEHVSTTEVSLHHLRGFGKFECNKFGQTLTNAECDELLSPNRDGLREVPSLEARESKTSLAYKYASGEELPRLETGGKSYLAEKLFEDSVIPQGKLI